MMNRKQWLGYAAALILLGPFFNTQSLPGQESQRQFIPSSAFAAFDCMPKDALAQPSMEMIPHELIKVFGEQELGLELLQIERATFLMGEITDPEMNSPPQFGSIIRFSTPQSINRGLFRNGELKTIAGKEAFGDNEISMLLHDEKTLLFGSNEFLEKMLSAKGASSPLIKMMAEANATDHMNFYVIMEPVRSLLKQKLPARNEVPGPFRDFLKIPDLVEAITFRSNFSPDSVAEYRIRAVDQKSVAELQRLINHAFDLGKNAALSAITTQMEIPEAYQQATLAYAERLSRFIEAAIEPEIDGNDMVFDVNQNPMMGGYATTGILVGMLLPAVQQVREAARRTQSMNNLRQLALAAHNYEAAYNHFPMNAIYDENGQPLLSWRVHLLPYLDEVALYEQFKLDDPWDSPHNIKLLDKMPATFQNPNSTSPRGMTNYLAIAGEGTVFPGNKKIGFQDIIDGSSNTVMFVEADESEAVEWTRPQDLDFDVDDPMAGLGNLRPGGFLSALCDGSVRFIDNSIDWDTWKRVVLASDGEVVDW